MKSVAITIVVLSTTTLGYDNTILAVQHIRRGRKMAVSNSQAWAEALNATTYQLVTPALAQAMVHGKKTGAIKGSIYGTFNTLERALQALEEGCKRFAPTGRNLKTGKVESMRVYTAVVVETTRGQSTIIG